MKEILLKPEKCTGCRTCEMICSYNEAKNFSPEHSSVRVKVDEEEALAVPFMCLHCDDAPCIDACPTEAMHRDKNGMVKCDDDNCTGCEACVSACQWNAISYSQPLGRILKCEMCGGDPGCVKYCPSGCLEYREGGDLFPRQKAMNHVIKKETLRKEAL